MYDQLSFDVFEDGAVAGRVRYRQVKRRPAPVRQVGRVDAELVPAQRGDGLVDRGEVVEHILGPDAQAHHRAVVVRPRVRRLGQKQQIGHESPLVHAVASADVVSGRDDAAVAGGPPDRMLAETALFMHASRKQVDVRLRVFLPIHRAAGDDHAVGTQIYGSRAGFRTGRDEQSPGSGRKSDHKGCGARAAAFGRSMKRIDV